MSFDTSYYSETRDKLQKSLDALRSPKERNIMGQFATPYHLACDIMKKAKALSANVTTNFIEPSIGLGAFFDAFLNVFGDNAGHALGFEIDPHYYEPAKELWANKDIELRNMDFLKAAPTNEKFGLLVANPPYVRHHHISQPMKTKLQEEVLQNTGIRISGLAGLYCYFLILSEKWLSANGLSCWLIPSEFMDVNYGKAIKQYLLYCVDLLCIHKFNANDVQFDDALVSSTVVFFRKSKPITENVVFSYGNKVTEPLVTRQINKSDLQPDDKWSNLVVERSISKNADCRIGNFFTVKRGIATGDNGFFILDKKTIEKYKIPDIFLKPILPSPRHLKGDIVTSDKYGNIELDNMQYLFVCGMPEKTLAQIYPNVWQYIQEGVTRNVNKGYICSHRPLWYYCEDRKPAPFIIPYMGRGDSSKRMFRFILNQSDAITTNGYLLMYPKTDYLKCLTDTKLLHSVWSALNKVSPEQFALNGREYGGGLHKLEPKELLNVEVPELPAILSPRRSAHQLSLF